ncbi:MAG TPA: EAL domain-containing protein [Candidatus Angelobacter sp.]|jgi:diguanylate cyclase (GGDEF)-like protein|nr:EAL domain-containing protein [Candidatus Angelobacter sp.]
MTPSGGSWSTQQLSEFLVAVAACRDQGSAIAGAIQWAAEALEAEIAAVVDEAGVTDSVGFPRGQVPVDELRRIAAQSRGDLHVEGLGLLHAVAVPVEGGTPGRLVLGRSGVGFEPEETSLLRAMARGLALTLDNLQMLERERRLREVSEQQAADNLRLLGMLQERQALLERLSKIQVSISRRAPLHEVLDAIVAGAGELLGDEVIGLRLVDREDPDYMTLVSITGVDEETRAKLRRSRITEGVGGRAIIEDRLVVVEDYANADMAMAAFAEADLRAAMAAPVHENGRPVGSIVVATNRPDRRYTETEREMLMAFAHHASLALNDAKVVEEMRHLAYHDSLTGLPNRALFTEHLERALARARRGGSRVTVLFLDLDRFKMVNDSLGHAAGDELLVAVGQRLRSCLRATDVAARLGGDEFAILAEDSEGVTDADVVAERILEALREPISVHGRELSVTASVGVAVSGCADGNAEALLRNADLAMYRAKVDGLGRYLVFEQQMHTLLSERVEMEADLRRAIGADEFVLHYQPIVALAGGDIVGVEALVRWARGGKVLTSPKEFIPVAEEMGLIVPIGRWVLRESMRQVREWQEKHLGLHRLGVSVNISARQLRQPELVDDIVAALHATHFDPSCLTLEITETALMRDTSRALETLNNLRSLGIRLALDDFGTGYSSLSYLREFPIDSIKIDKSFVDGITHGSEEAAVARAVIELGRTLNIDTVAEGIEERHQLDELRNLRCGYGQGYHFSMPLPAEGMEPLLRLESMRVASHLDAAEAALAAVRMGRGEVRSAHA